MKKIMIIADVPNWAWGIKASYLRKYLSKQFDIYIWYLDHNRKRSIPSNMDLYLTFHPHHIDFLKHINKDRKITGVTGVSCFPKWIDGKYFNNEVAAIHANSIGLLNMLRGKHKKIYYVPNGVDCNLFESQSFVEHKKLVVGFVGKASLIKGVNDFIIPAVKQSKNTRLTTRINGWSRAIPQKALAKFYKFIDVYIVASEMEGTPNPALEAAACGRTIVANRVGNMPEFIQEGKNGFLIPRKIDSYVEKLEFLQDNRGLIKELGRQARLTALKWDWKIQVKNYEKMFVKVLGL